VGAPAGGSAQRGRRGPPRPAGCRDGCRIGAVYAAENRPGRVGQVLHRRGEDVGGDGALKPGEKVNSSPVSSLGGEDHIHIFLGVFHILLKSKE
jgi:hypothetical protein